MKLFTISLRGAFVALLLALAGGLVPSLMAQTAQLKYYVGTNLSTSPFYVCPPAGSKDFRVECYGNAGGFTFGSNPYKFTVTLLRNGSVVSHPANPQVVTMSTAFYGASFNGTSAPVGNYTATVKMERRTAPFVWVQDAFVSTNTVQGLQSLATPNFTINGAFPVAGVVTTSCYLPVTMDASFTSCENNYFLEVVETDPYGNVTGAYGWSQWFSGQAPANLDLQGLCNTYGTGPMVSGNLGNGLPRHYRVKLATNDPTWVSKETLLRIENSVANFNINGNAVSNGQVLSGLCQYDIYMDAGSSSCENSYRLEILETDQNGVATGLYGWARWFTGQAPDGLDLQVLCAQNSVPPYYSGSPNRQGTVMMGGNLANGTPRYYRATLTTNSPAVSPKYVLLRIMGTFSCRVGAPKPVVVAQGAASDAEGEDAGGAVAFADEVQVYPNPARDAFGVQVRCALSGPCVVSVLDGQGREVLREGADVDSDQVTELSFARAGQMGSGLYFVRVVTPAGVTTRKILLQ